MMIKQFYPIIHIDDDAPELLEQQGTKTKFWFKNEHKQLFLFKAGRLTTGENWAEKIACELCELLELPHAHYEFAKWKNQKGVITQTIVPTNGSLVMGNELLSKIHSTYPAEQRYKVKDHTLGRITTLLNDSSILLSPNWTTPSNVIEKAIDVFLGYLLLDAWIANQDRHHENWAVIHHDNKIYLAPTYDHAASLGQNETDENRIKRLTTHDKGQHINNYVKKARSAIYLKAADTKPLLTLAVFKELAKERSEAAKVWRDRLHSISEMQCRTLFEQIPPSEITETAIEFALKLLALNKERLLE